jgi:replication factor A1
VKTADSAPAQRPLNCWEGILQSKNTGKKSRKTLKNRVSAGEYLAFLSVKYEVDPDVLFNALVSAGKNRESECGTLTIERRGETQDKIVFLILKDSTVVAQFPIFKEFLLERDNPVRRFMKTDMIRRHLVRKNRTACSLPIRDLRTGMSQISLKATVLEIPAAKLVFTRFGNHASVANALIADETGTIKLCLWNEQIGSISIGDTIQLENVRASTYRGERQLNIGKKGTLNNIKDMISPQLEVLHGS